MARNPIRQPVVSRDTVIDAGAAVSSMIDLAGLGPRGFAVLVPSAWTAANIGFEASTDNSTWIKLYDVYGARVKITGIATAAAGLYATPPETWSLGAFRYLRLVSLNTSTGADENQASARALTVALMY